MVFATLACERENQDPDFPFTITVKTFQDSIRVTNAFVIINAPVPGNTAYFEGYTNESGEVSFTYDREAIFEVRAVRGDVSSPSFSGCTIIRLEPDQRVEKTVYMKGGDMEDRDC